MIFSRKLALKGIRGKESQLQKENDCTMSGSVFVVNLFYSERDPECLCYEV